MTAPPADVLASTLGLDLPGKERQDAILVPPGREMAGQQLAAAMDAWGESNDKIIMIEFASRYLPALVNVILHPFFGKEEDQFFDYTLALLKAILVSTPSFGRLLRGRRFYKPLHARLLALLLRDNSRWSHDKLSASTEAGLGCQARLGLLVGLPLKMMAFSTCRGYVLSEQFSEETLIDAFDRVPLLNAFLQDGRSRASGDDLEEVDATLSDIAAIAKGFSTGFFTFTFEMSSPYGYWEVCEAATSAELGPCTELSAGQEMSCCGKCLAVRYCSRAHQKAHWKTHKPVCFKPTW